MSPASKPGARGRPRDARARGRELALLALCHLDGRPADERVEALTLLWANPPREDDDDERGRGFADAVADAEARRRADGLLRPLIEQWARLDEVLTETSERWRLERMALVDRNVLRLAAFELAERSDTPRGVVLSEAVRLARRYGSERSGSFVNGVAEALARRLRGAAAPGSRRKEPGGA